MPATCLTRLCVWPRSASIQGQIHYVTYKSHELEEAEGYEILLLKHHRYDVEQLCAKVGRSRGYVYARLKLLALDKKSREAFYAGKLTAATALLLARIPVPALQ